MLLPTVKDKLVFHEEDQVLVEKSQSDPRYFEVLYNKYFHQIFSFVFNRVRDKDHAADLTSKVFIKAYTNISKFEYKEVPYSAWLFRVAINETNMFFRAHSKERFVVLNDRMAEVIAEGTAEQSIYDQPVFREKLKKALDSLLPDDLELIELRFFEEMSFREVGQVLGITENYAKVKTYRVLNKLRKAF